MRLPFWLENKEWEGLHPRESDGLADDSTLTPREKAIVATIQTIDRRSEWTAKTVVDRNNLAILAFLALSLVAASTVIVIGPVKTAQTLIEILKTFSQ